MPQTEAAGRLGSGETGASPPSSCVTPEWKENRVPQKAACDATTGHATVNTC